MRHRRVPGHALRSDDQWRALAPMLRELHSVPTEQAGSVLNEAGTVAQCYSGFARLRAPLNEALTAVLPDTLQQRIVAVYDRFLADAGEFAQLKERCFAALASAGFVALD